MPNQVTGLKMMELLTRTKTYHKYFLHCHVWACPVFVMDSKLQHGKKIFKCNHILQLGQFLDFSDENSFLVAKIPNLTTGYISPQYHVVFDDFFRQFVELFKIKLSLMIFEIKCSNTLRIIMLSNSLDKMVN